MISGLISCFTSCFTSCFNSMWACRLPLLLAGAVALTTGCEWLGFESVADVRKRQEIDGRAIGGACRHAGRAIEDCFASFAGSSRAAIFDGWREMNDYMTENKMQSQAPKLSRPTRESDATIIDEPRPSRGDAARDAVRAAADAARIKTAPDRPIPAQAVTHEDVVSEPSQKGEEKPGRASGALDQVPSQSPSRPIEKQDSSAPLTAGS